MWVRDGVLLGGRTGDWCQECGIDWRDAVAGFGSNVLPGREWDGDTRRDEAKYFDTYKEQA